jgi:hypothetical protein
MPPDVQTGRLQASKWLKYQALLDTDEIAALLDALEPFLIYRVSDAILEDKACIEKTDFLNHYARYIDGLKAGSLIDERLLRPYFSSVFTVSRELLHPMVVAGGKVLMRPTRPVVQLQLHHFFASQTDGQIYPMVQSHESTSWGIQFSYPQLYQDLKTQEIKKVDSKEPNTALFSRLTKWMRANTQPTPFLFQGKKINSPIRIGKRCFAWIAHHPGLAARGLAICT